MTKKLLGVLLALVMAFVTFAMPAAEAAPRVGRSAYVTKRANFRAGPGLGYRIKRVLPRGAKVNVLSKSRSYWYKVSYRGSVGYMGSGLLRTSSTGGGSDDDDDNDSSSRTSYSGGTAKGRAIARTARSLTGYRYVWGGESRRTGFDCSGLVYYSYRVHGISIPRGSRSQFRAGRRVSRSNLQPGDAVYFQTWKPGPSHAGLYIGGGKMVEASNPRIGIKVTSIYNSYYDGRWVGGRRFY